MQGGIPRTAPPKLALQLLRLPPILHNRCQNSVPCYSKAPRGLFVQPRVTGVYTRASISPSIQSRQRPSRWTFHAGQNLPDKELRYLRTVIVTAALHWGFSLARQRLPLTFQQWAGFRLYTSSFELAESCVFAKQSLRPILCGHPRVAPLIPKLRGHFAEFLNWISLVHLRILSLPTCVGFGTDSFLLARGFSRPMIPFPFALERARHHTST